MKFEELTLAEKLLKLKELQSDMFDLANAIALEKSTKVGNLGALMHGVANAFIEPIKALETKVETGEVPTWVDIEVAKQYAKNNLMPLDPMILGMIIQAGKE